MSVSVQKKAIRANYYTSVVGDEILDERRVRLEESWANEISDAGEEYIRTRLERENEQ